MMMHPPMMMPMAQAAAAGRGGDTMVAHTTPGEMVVPGSVQQAMTPDMRAQLRQAFIDAGMRPERYIVGSPAQSMNPITGSPEFYDASPDGYSDGYAEGIDSSGNVAGPAQGYGMSSGPFGGYGSGGPGSETAASAAQAKAQNNPQVDPKSDTLGLYGSFMSALGMNPFRAAEDEANWRSTMAETFISKMSPVSPKALNSIAQTIGYGINSALKAIGIEPQEQGVQRGSTGHPGEGHSGPTDPMMAARPTDPTAPTTTPYQSPAWMPPAAAPQPQGLAPPRVADPREMLRPLFTG